MLVHSHPEDRQELLTVKKALAGLFSVHVQVGCPLLLVSSLCRYAVCLSLLCACAGRLSALAGPFSVHVQVGFTSLAGQSLLCACSGRLSALAGLFSVHVQVGFTALAGLFSVHVQVGFIALAGLFSMHVQVGCPLWLVSSLCMFR